MLRHALFTACSVLLVSPTLHAQGEEPEDGLRRPERITVGSKDQFLGQLSPDERTLYFVSNGETRKEIYAQDIAQGHVHLLFDEGSDVTWPRLSPDGKQLLYISFRDQATGQLCVRDVPDGAHRRCLGGTRAALEADWIGNKRIVLVARTSIDANLTLSDVSVAATLSARPLYDQNWTSPTVSPDGRWLVYVPLDRVTKSVGPGFAARAAHRLEAVRLDSKSAPMPITLDLPGLTGQPAFSRDGRSLYVSQFLSDSNRDGVIDASDHGVLFSVPFPTNLDDAPSRAAAATPLQLTDSGSNCQYPAPSKTHLVATCSRGTNLDVYEVPLDGEIPNDWSADRLRLEVELASRRSEQLMLYRHALLLEPNVSRQRLLLMRLLMLHLALEQFDAAAFYAEKVAKLRDPSTRGIARPLTVLVDHRRARSALERGLVIDTFAGQVQEQLARLRQDPEDSAAAHVLNHVVFSEIADSVGDKTKAKAELEAAIIDDATPPGTVAFYFARADALYRELDDRDALFAVCKHLATNQGLSADERLDYARAGARALARGLPFEQAQANLARAREAESADSELAFALDLATAVLGIVDPHPPPEVKARLLALYQSQTRVDRKRAVMLDALQPAAELGADSLIEALSERYVDDAVPGTEERRRAEQLYRRALLGRAFRRLAKGHRAEALADFDAVFKRTSSFEAAEGAIDLRLANGERPGLIASALLHGSAPSSPNAHFVNAYLLARSLPELRGEAHAKAVAEAQSLLRSDWGELKKKGIVRLLYGAIMHEDYLRSGSLAAAESANSQYLMALELMQENPRGRASLLTQLGLLQLAVGNYRIALGYLQDRARLPDGDSATTLAVRMATAQALLHVDREEDSAAMSEKALAQVAQTPELAAYQALALDRAALYNLAASHFVRALALYDRELTLLAPATTPTARRNRFVVRLARAAAALGATQPESALADLIALEPEFADPVLLAALASRHVSADQAARSYRTIAAGLRANAELALGRIDAATAALGVSRELRSEQLANTNRDEDEAELALADTRLADAFTQRGNLTEASQALATALAHSDAFVARTRVDVDVDQLRVLWFAAELDLRGHAPSGVDVTKRLGDAYSKIVASRDPVFRPYERWFEVYLAMKRASAPASAALSNGAH